MTWLRRRSELPARRLDVAPPSEPLFVLLGVLSLWGFVSAWARPAGTPLAWWGGVSILALWTEYFALFFVVAEAAALLARRGSRRAAAPAVACVVAGAVLVTPLLYHQSGNGLTTWIAETPWHTRLFDAAQWWVAGAGAVSHIWWVVAGVVLLTVTLLAATSSGAELRGALVAAGVGLAVVVGPLLAAALGEDLWLFRNVIVAWIPFVLVLSTALTGRAGPRTVAVGAAAIAVALLAAEGVLAVRLVRWQVPIRDNWRGFAQCLADTPGSRLLVIVPAHNAIALSYYRPSIQPAGTADTVGEFILVGRPAAGFHPPRGFRRTEFTCSSGIRAYAYRSPLPRHVRPTAIGPTDSLFLDRPAD